MCFARQCSAMPTTAKPILPCQKFRQPQRLAFHHRLGISRSKRSRCTFRRSRFTSVSAVTATTAGSARRSTNLAAILPISSSPEAATLAKANAWNSNFPCVNRHSAACWAPRSSATWQWSVSIRSFAKAPPSESCSRPAAICCCQKQSPINAAQR